MWLASSRPRYSRLSSCDLMIFSTLRTTRFGVSILFVVVDLFAVKLMVLQIGVNGVSSVCGYSLPTCKSKMFSSGCQLTS